VCGHDSCMPAVSMEIPAYSEDRGVNAGTEGDGDIVVRSRTDGVEIIGNPAGLRDLARWCLALAAPDAPDGSHVRLEPSTEMLAPSSVSLLLARQEVPST
jgi:hypothetical protein